MPDNDADLVYNARARNRPRGASDLTQRIYGLLTDHPDGMTLDELHLALRDGWMATDIYRAYEQRRVYEQQRYARASLRKYNRAKRSEQIAPSSQQDASLLKGRREQYGTPEFKRQAQRWGIQRRLHGMKERGSVHHEGDRWFARERAPRVRVADENQKLRLAPLDVQATRLARQADTQVHVRREQVKAQILAVTNDPSSVTKKQMVAILEEIYEYLCNR